MTSLIVSGGITDEPADASGVWRPFVDEPLLKPEMLLGWANTPPADQLRMSRYLSALVATRRGPVHVNTAFNAVYFGYDLGLRAYVGGPLDLSAFPKAQLGETIEALPVGALINVATGGDPLFAEVVYKEGAHPALSSDGRVPTWLSGAPAGVTGPGTAEPASDEPVLSERLIIDVDAFGRDFSLTAKQMDRLRHRGRFIGADGHLVLDARYGSRRDADLDDTAFYAQHLLTTMRGQLLSTAAPMPLSTVLADDVSEDQLAAALNALLRTVADALVSLEELRTWRGYSFTRTSLAARLKDPGPLGGDDLSTVAAGLARGALPQHRGRWQQAHSVSYTAVGPRLREVQSSASQLVGIGYATAVCHANMVISDYANREKDETTGLLHGQIHLRLDDPWQGGGVWRAEQPGSDYVDVDVTEPLGLGWTTALADAQPEREQLAVEPRPEAPVPPDPDEIDEAIDLTVVDSQVSWTSASRLSHQLQDRMPLPETVCTQLRDCGLRDVRLRLVLSHDGYDLEPADAVQSVNADLLAGHELTGVMWPLEFFPGILITYTWERGAGVIRGTSRLLDRPMTVDGQLIEHRYDPKIFTRDAAPGQDHRKGARPLTLAQQVEWAIRRFGLLNLDGSAALARQKLPAALAEVGCDARETEVAAAIDELLVSGLLRAETASVGQFNGSGTTRTNSQTTSVIIYQPRVVEGPLREYRPGQNTGHLRPGAVRSHRVVGHLRRLVNQTASDTAREAYRHDRIRFGLTGPVELPNGYTYELPDGYTYVLEHSRGGHS